MVTSSLTPKKYTTYSRWQYELTHDTFPSAVLYTQKKAVQAYDRNWLHPEFVH